MVKVIMDTSVMSGVSEGVEQLVYAVSLFSHLCSFLCNQIFFKGWGFLCYLKDYTICLILSHVRNGLKHKVNYHRVRDLVRQLQRLSGTMCRAFCIIAGRNIRDHSDALVF